MANTEVPEGTRVVAMVDGDEWAGTVRVRYNEGGLEMATVETDEEFWTGEFELGCDIDDLRFA